MCGVQKAGVPGLGLGGSDFLLGGSVYLLGEAKLKELRVGFGRRRAEWGCLGRAPKRFVRGVNRATGRVLSSVPRGNVPCGWGFGLEVSGLGLGRLLVSA
jgi:hypothetical protein